MKVFAMLMLRCALIMHLSSFLQNGTLATLGEWDKSCQKLEEWKNSISLGSITSDDLINIPKINCLLNKLLNEVNKFPIKEMEELLDRRLQKPLKVAIGNYKKLLNEKHSGREGDKKYLESLLSKIRSIANGIVKEFNTFSVEVELKLFTKFYRTLQKRVELGNKLLHFVQLSPNSYSDVDYFLNEWTLLSIGMGNNPRYEPGTTEFVDFVESFILNAKLNILKNEMSAKIAGFVEQQHFDWNGFMEFSPNFKREWNQIEQQIDQVSNRDIADIIKERYRTELDDLAQNAMKETAKGIITKVQQNFYVMLMPNSTPTTFYQILKVTKKLGEMKNEDQIWLNLADSKMFFTILYDLKGLEENIQQIKIKKEPENHFCVLAHFVDDLLEEMASGNKIPKIESIEVAIGHFILVKEELCKEKSIENDLKQYFGENLVNFGKAINIDFSPHNELHQVGRELVKEIEEMLQNGDNWNYAYLNSSKMDEWNLLEYDLRKTGNDQKWEEIEQLRGEWKNSYNTWVFNKETEKKPNFEQMMTNLIKILRNFIMPQNVREIVLAQKHERQFADTKSGKSKKIKVIEQTNEDLNESMPLQNNLESSDEDADEDENL